MKPESEQAVDKREAFSVLPFGLQELQSQPVNMERVAEAEHRRNTEKVSNKQVCMDRTQ